MCRNYLLLNLFGLLIVIYLSNKVDGVSTKTCTNTSGDNWIQKIGADGFGKTEKKSNGNGLPLVRNHSKRETINSNKQLKDEIKLIRKRWKANTVGDIYKLHKSLNDARFTANEYIEKLSRDATKLYKTRRRYSLWRKNPLDTRSADLTTQFKKLNTVAKAYGTFGTALYNNTDVLAAIVSGLDFMTEEGRYSGTKMYGNWWDWQIGVPQEFIQILLIIYDDMKCATIEKYVSIMENYLPNPYLQINPKPQTELSDIEFMTDRNNTAANLADIALSILGLGIMTNNSSKIYEAVNSMNEVFSVVTTGDGFYADGSFIQHQNISYTGNYGCVLIRDGGIIFSIIAGTRWEVKENTLIDYIQRAKDAFIPLIVNGQVMSFVSGRLISRAPEVTKYGFNTNAAFEYILYDLLVCTEFANQENKLTLKQAVKYWMVKDFGYYIKHARDIKDLFMIKQLMADESIDTSKKPFLGSHMYGSMDRFVFSDNFTTIGISMYSTRIFAFEAINNENKKGWHTADGMVYLYNDDQQFGSKYWPTVDWYRLPGTTVDTRPLVDDTPLKYFVSIEDYVGGATDEIDSVVSMQLNKAGTLNAAQKIDMNLTAKKSWFIFDGIIISLGTDINGSTTNGSIQTIIENRLLDASSAYEFFNQDGKEINTMDCVEVSASDWFFLKYSEKNQSIGYLMLANQNITSIKEERNGTYKEINNRFSNDIVYTGIYQKLIVEHGNEINGGNYAYLTYPRATEDVLSSLQNEQRFTILANTKEIQAVKDNRKNKMGATIWNATGGIISGVAVNTSASFIYEETNTQITLSVSNPKQTDEYIEVQIPQEVKEILSQDNGVKMIDKYTVVVNTTNALGKTFQFKARVHIQLSP